MATQPTRILLVDDTPSHRKLYASWLGLGGYVSHALDDSRQAQEFAEDYRPAAILVDIRMPYLSGLDLIAAFKSSAATRHIPVMALTVLNSHDDEDACFAAGADAFVPKPAHLDTFLATIRTLLAR